MSSDKLQALQPGDPEQIGQYHLLARLGAGGMGRVYLGRSRGGRTVVVKVIHSNLADDARFRRRFTLEVAAARRVGGFHTAQVVDADTDADPPWFVTEYIAGPSLHEAVDGHGPLPAQTVAALGAGLAEGLTAIHNHDVIHRDLKPGNVLLATDGPRIIDFGIARAVDASSQTTRTSVVGTPGFMSPEQYRGREVGPSSDVFCLATVLAFAATGRRPFGDGPSDAVGYRIVNEDPDLTDVPASLLPLIAAGLEKDPDDRPGVTEFLDHCSRVAEGKGLSLPTPITRAINTRLAETEAFLDGPKATKLETEADGPKATKLETDSATSQETVGKPSAGAWTAAAVSAIAAVVLIGGVISTINEGKDSASSGADADYSTSNTDSDSSTSYSSDSDYYDSEESSSTTDPTYEAFESIGAGDCLDAYVDPYEEDEWSQHTPNAVDCDRTDAYMRVTSVGDSVSTCDTDYLNGKTWWDTSDLEQSEMIYLCVERQLRVGECFLGKISDNDKDGISINNHGLTTSWGCNKDTVPQDFDYILQVTAITNGACPNDSYTWDFRGKNLCAEVV